MSAFNQTEPQPIVTPQNDETLGGNFLEIGHIRDPRHRQYLRKLNTIFDEDREKFTKQLEFIEYDPATKSRKIVYSPFKPEFEGTDLIDSKTFMYSLSKIAVILCFDTKFNENISLLLDETNELTWTAKTPGPTKLAIKLENNDNIEGIGITFDNSMGSQYDFTVSFINESNQIVSQILNASASILSSRKQFFILKNPVNSINRITLELTEIGPEQEQQIFYLRNISVFNYVNKYLLGAMFNSNIISYNEIDNPVYLREAPKEDTSDNPLMTSQQ